MAKKKPGRPAKKTAERFLAAIDAVLAHEDYDTDQEGFWALVDTATEADPGTDLGEKWTDLHLAWLDFCKEVDVFDERWNPNDMPHDKLWAAIADLTDCRNTLDAPPKSAMPPEGIKAYSEAPGMGHDQVALAFGLVDSRGVPQLDLVRKELDEPGSVLDKNYVHPDDAKGVERRQEAHTAYVERLQAIQEVKEVKEAEDSAECPETPQELYEQGIGEEQYAIMLKLTPEQVKKQWAKFEKAGVVRKETPVTSYEVDDKGEPVPLSAYVPTIAETDPLVEGIDIPIEQPAQPEVDQDRLDVYGQMDIDELRGLIVSGIEDGAKMLTANTTKEDMMMILAEADEAALAEVGE